MVRSRQLSGLGGIGLWSSPTEFAAFAGLDVGPVPQIIRPLRDWTLAQPRTLSGPWGLDVGPIPQVPGLRGTGLWSSPADYPASAGLDCGPVPQMMRLARDWTLVQEAPQ